MTDTEEPTVTRSGKRVLAIAAVAAAVAAIAITVPLVLRDAPDEVRPAAAVAPAHPVQPPVPNQPAFWQRAMAYEPGWLPAGVVEQNRGAAAKSVSRVWRVPPTADWPGPFVTVEVVDDVRVSKTDDVIDVHGVPAYIDSTAESTRVTWEPKPGVQLMTEVQGGLEHRDFAIHIARALRSDGTKQFRALVDLGWCPFHDGVGSMTLGSVPAEAGGHASCDRDQPRPVAQVLVEVRTQRNVTSGTPVTVRGRQGLYAKATKTGMQTVSVPLGDGRYLEVGAGNGGMPGYEPVSKADLVKVANTAVIHDAAYVDWVGTR